MNPLTEKIRPHVPAIQADAAAGCQKAKHVISLYQMHASCPSDPHAPVLCDVAFDDWFSARGKAAI